MSLLACSGPGAMRIITRNIETATLHAGATAALFVLSLVFCLFANRNRWFFPGVILAMLLVHPLWTVSPYHGDCGDFLVQAAMSVTAWRLPQ